eukprot:TRINITY_DN92489_c0_g1_i1.p2 TRINITY_DN92489_c0_g1~~TRINITY_DN92489_c0_g1_i1.p2  ORF type:complete len:230 (-),score=79.20 TRINITY_DN92489_c0_g1_i1:133-822(-)
MAAVAMVKVAEVAEKAEMHDDMRAYMAHRVRAGGPLNAVERSLFSDSFKESVGARREAVHCLDQQAKVLEGQRLDMTMNYKSKVEAELAGICREAVELIDTLLPTAGAGAIRAFYLKMKADYYRYRATATSVDANLQQFIEDASATYAEAMNEVAMLPPASPIRLQVALNYSVFQKEVLNQVAEAIQTASQARNLASTEEALAHVTENEQESVETSLTLLGRNLDLWTS